MRTLLLAFVCLLFSCFISLALAEDITGQWITPAGDALIEVKAIVERSGEESVSLVLKRSLREQLDDRNPDPALRDRPLIDLPIGGGFSRKGKDWVGGKIYDPASGKTYRASLSLDDENHLLLRGYIGIPALGRSQILVRRQHFEKLLRVMLGAGEAL